MATKEPPESEAASKQPHSSSSVFKRVHEVPTSGQLDRIRGSCAVPAITYYVVHEGKIISDGGVGFGKNSSFHEAPDSQSLFTSSSLSKVFVVLCVGILVDEGKLEWTSPVNTYLPEYAPQQDKTGHVATATINEVLRHSSGLANPTTSFIGPHGKVIPSKDDFIQVLNATPTTYRGKSLHNEWLYSNLAYALIVLVIEEVSKTSFDQFLQNKVLQPLGMRHTAVTKTQVEESNNFAQSYVQLDDKSWEKIDHEWTNEHNTPILGMIGIRSSAKDMMVLTCALMQAYSRTASLEGRQALGVDTWPNESFELLVGVENPLKQVGSILNGSYWWIPCTHETDGHSHQYRHYLPWVKFELPCPMLSWGSWNITMSGSANKEMKIFREENMLGQDKSNSSCDPLIGYTFGGTGFCGNGAIKFFPKTRTAVVTFSSGLNVGDAAEFANLAFVQAIFDLKPHIDIMRLVHYEVEAQKKNLAQMWEDIEKHRDTSPSQINPSDYVGEYRGLGIRLIVQEATSKSGLELCFHGREDLVFALEIYSRDKFSYWPHTTNQWRVEGWLDWDHWDVGVLHFRRDPGNNGVVTGAEWIWEKDADPYLFKRTNISSTLKHDTTISRKPLRMAEMFNKNEIAIDTDSPNSQLETSTSPNGKDLHDLENTSTGKIRKHENGGLARSDSGQQEPDVMKDHISSTDPCPQAPKSWCLVM